MRCGVRPCSVGPCWAGRCEQGAAGSLPVVSPLKPPSRLLPPSPCAGACWRFRESRERPIHHARALRGALPPSVCLSVCLSVHPAGTGFPAGRRARCAPAARHRRLSKRGHGHRACHRRPGPPVPEAQRGSRGGERSLMYRRCRGNESLGRIPGPIDPPAVYAS